MAWNRLPSAAILIAHAFVNDLRAFETLIEFKGRFLPQASAWCQAQPQQVQLSFV